jgi:hypothetical protein
MTMKQLWRKIRSAFYFDKRLGRKRYLIFLILAMVSTAASFFASRLSMILPQESQVATCSNARRMIKKHVFPHSFYDDSFIQKKFLLINVSLDYGLGVNTGYSNSVFLPKGLEPVTPITDRQKLSRLFRWLSAHPDQYNYVVCDLLFEGATVEGNGSGNSSTRSRYDDTLRNYLELIQRSGKVLFAGKYDDHNQQYYPGLYPSLRDENKGAANKDVVDEYIRNYRLTRGDNGIPTLPLRMLERLDGVTIKPSLFGFLGLSHHSTGESYSSWNSFIPDMTFSKEDIDAIPSFAGATVPDSTIGMIQLGEAVSDTDILPSLLYKKEAVKKNIFIGAFTHDHADMHKTLFGDLDGSLVILNIYYDLVQEQNSLNIIYFLSMVVCFFFFWWLFYVHLGRGETKHRWLMLGVELFWDGLPLLMLFGMTLLSYLIFDRIMNFFILSFFMVAIKAITGHLLGKRPETSPSSGPSLVD